MWNYAITPTEQGFVTVLAEIVHRDACSVELEAYVNGEYYIGTGVARRHPEDEFDREIGTKLAYARALYSISRQLERQANGAVKHADDMKSYKREQHTVNVNAYITRKF